MTAKPVPADVVLERIIAAGIHTLRRYKNDYQYRRTDRYRPVLYGMAVEPLFAGVRTFTQPIISKQSDTL